MELANAELVRPWLTRLLLLAILASSSAGLAASPWQRLKTTWSSPAGKKRIIGKVALGTALLATGEAIDHSLAHYGVQPVARAFASNALPTVAGYFAQRRLHVWRGDYFEAPRQRSAMGLARDAFFASAVGVGLQLGLDSLGDVFDRTLDADSGAMGRLLLAPAKTLAKKLGKSVTAPARWAVRKANEKVIGDHAGRARDAATSRYFSMKEAEE